MNDQRTDESISEISSVTLDDIPNFDHKKNSLEPAIWLDYFEKIADLKEWKNQEKTMKLISKVDETLQYKLLKVFNFGYSEVRRTFLETKPEINDFIGILEKQYNPAEDLKLFLQQKKHAATALAQRTSEELYVESVRRSLPVDYQWINSVKDVECSLSLKLQKDQLISNKMNEMTDRKLKKETFKKLRFNLLKKAYELSSSCGSNIAMIIFDESGKLSQYASYNMDQILMEYVNYEEACKENYTNKDIASALSRKERLKKANSNDQEQSADKTEPEVSILTKEDRSIKRPTNNERINLPDQTSETDKLDDLTQQLIDLNINDTNQLGRTYYEFILKQCLVLLNANSHNMLSQTVELNYALNFLKRWLDYYEILVFPDAPAKHTIDTKNLEQSLDYLNNLNKMSQTNTSKKGTNVATKVETKPKNDLSQPEIKSSTENLYSKPTDVKKTTNKTSDTSSESESTKDKNSERDFKKELNRSESDHLAGNYQIESDDDFVFFKLKE